MNAIIADDSTGEAALPPTVAEEQSIAIISDAAPVFTPAPASTSTTAATSASPPKRRAKPLDTRVTGQPGFVLHSYPHRETSLIIDVFSRDYGRIALVAKGAKRPLSKLRGVLQTFQPLSLSWSGKSEVRTLIAAEWVGGMLPLEKSALLCGFYLNELLVKLVARDDPHAILFDHYVTTLNQLAHQEPAPIVLRQFERALLKQTGVAGDFTRCTSSRQPVDPAESYVVDPERGPRLARAADSWPRVSGKTLLDMEREDYSDVVTQAQSKVLMRFLLAHHLGGAPLNTRQILIDLMQL
ncbi:DNA replication and repair protein RecO [Collimonas sp. OK607]|uniref:DNA repair protein RecO n=1 Tax=Collimonas sp. OK607 TaxID=1798194 RepID=UPI0008E5D05E|nr:DNA repair protein RecO [Collimonas sp. OK607]SFA90798.1 DNA replication and repair protein RecO [Collimonas sp. OK607]